MSDDADIRRRLAARRQMDARRAQLLPAVEVLRPVEVPAPAQAPLRTALLPLKTMQPHVLDVSFAFLQRLSYVCQVSEHAYRNPSLKVELDSDTIRGLNRDSNRLAFLLTGSESWRPVAGEITAPVDDGRLVSDHLVSDLRRENAMLRQELAVLRAAPVVERQSVVEVIKYVDRPVVAAAPSKRDEIELRPGVTWEKLPNKDSYVGVHQRYLTYHRDGEWVPVEEWEAKGEFNVDIPNCPQQELAPIVSSLISRMGGKSELKEWLVDKFPKEVKTYVEPFGGSFQVFLYRPWRNPIEIINDVDADLVDFFRWVVNEPESLYRFVDDMPLHEALVMGMRRGLQDKSLSGLERAAAFYIVSTTGFSSIVSTGLGRYKSSPSAKLSIGMDRKLLMEVAKRLRGVDIRSTSVFRLLEHTVKPIEAGAFFYLDPPYDETAGYAGAAGNFTFGWEDQVKLADWCVKIDGVGSRVIQTNKCTERLWQLYSSFKRQDGSPMFELTKRKVMYTVNAEKQAETEELIISNTPLVSRSAKKQTSLF